MEIRGSGRAIASLVCGILSIFMPGVGFVLGILGIVFGAVARSEIRRSEGKLRGEGMAVAGLVCGIVGLATTVFWLSILRIIGSLFKSAILYNI
ncbi:MAG: DUF4190 domain-containing protein [bacterium]|nr:DUF4190 domain-containing protein [bacterium]